MNAQVRPAIHAGQAVVEALREEGVEKVYCVPGSHLLQFYDAFRQESSIRLITCKQEPNASLMADAYGRLTGRPGVCLLTAGPGAANSLAGVVQAHGAASPMVHITGAVPLDADREAFHGADDPEFVVKMYQNVTKWSVRIQRMEDIPSTMAKAFCIARSGRPGPVHVEIPRLSDSSPYLLQPEPVVLEPYRPEPVELSSPGPADVDRITTKLLEAKNPVICAGKGVIRKGAMRELAELSRKLSAPVVYPQDTIGVIPGDHPFAVGHFFRRRQSPLFEHVMKRADFLLSVGLRAGAAEISQLRGYAPEDHILIGFDSAEDDYYSGENQVVADPKLFLTALLERLEGKSRPADEDLKWDIARHKANLKEHLHSQIEEYGAAKPIHPGFLMETLVSSLTRDAIVVSDVGNCQIWGRYFIPINTRDSYMQSGIWNAMSFSLPTAIVAKMEFPERQVVGIAGDGAFLMTIGDFITACELKANIVMVILNDGAFGQMHRQQMDLYGKSYGCDFESPNFAEMARACGALGIRIEEPGEVEGALRAALAADRPAIVDVVTGDYSYPSMEGLLGR
ncbi:thiamine pyrophosphate-binding protein [Nitrospinota bacterium]